MPDCHEVFVGTEKQGVLVCTSSDWWLGSESTMSVVVNGSESYECHYFAMHMEVADEPGNWPGVFVLYQDGNMRIKPHPPSGYGDVCYGSSVIVGPATLDSRPYAEVESVEVVKEAQSAHVEITYVGSETAHVDFSVDRSHAVADVTVEGFPDHVAVFRSMWVEDGNADVDTITTSSGSFPIVSAWDELPGSAWLFHRQTESIHNQSAPDSWIVLDTPAVFRVDYAGTVYADGTFRAARIQVGSADVAEWVATTEPVSPGDVLEADPEFRGAYRKASSECSRLVAGVVSAEPGVVLGASGSTDGQALLALIGIVPVRVTDEGGPILPGDLLVSSSTPGHAMRWTELDACPCSLVGKALEPMTDETGIILVLLMTH